MRLTISHRDQICRTLINSKFDEAKVLQKKLGHQIATKIYEEAFSEADRKKMKRLPAGWLPKLSCVAVQTTGSYVRFSLTTPQPVPYEKGKGYNTPCLLNLTGKSKLKGIVDKFEQDRKDLKQQESQLRNEINGVLNSFNTDKQARDRWPEISKQILSVCGDGERMTTALAPRLDNLNKKLGLAI